MHLLDIQGSKPPTSLRHGSQGNSAVPRVPEGVWLREARPLFRGTAQEVWLWHEFTVTG